MVINRLYDMSAGEVAPKQKDKAVLNRLKEDYQDQAGEGRESPANKS